MDDRNGGITQDDVAVGMTRPSGKWGVTWPAFILNGLIAGEAFVCTHNMLWLLLVIPVHGVFYLACLHDPRIFDLGLLWCRTKGQALFKNFAYWRCSSYSPLAMHKKPSLKSRRDYRRLKNGK